MATTDLTPAHSLPLIQENLLYLDFGLLLALRDLRITNEPDIEVLLKLTMRKLCPRFLGLLRVRQQFDLRQPQPYLGWPHRAVEFFQGIADLVYFEEHV